MRDITNRQKLIKIADHSEFGWVVVEAYESNNLASDSEDKKTANKGGEDAERKLKNATDQLTLPGREGARPSRFPSHCNRWAIPHP